MKRNPQEIIKEIEETQEEIAQKELETYLLRNKIVKLTLELRDAT